MFLGKNNSQCSSLKYHHSCFFIGLFYASFRSFCFPWCNRDPCRNGKSMRNLLVSDCNIHFQDLWWNKQKNFSLNRDWKLSHHSSPKVQYHLQLVFSKIESLTIILCKLLSCHRPLKRKLLLCFLLESYIENPLNYRVFEQSIQDASILLCWWIPLTQVFNYCSKQ